MRKSNGKIMAAAEPNGDVEAVRQLGFEAKNSGAGTIALLGSMTRADSGPGEYTHILQALAEAKLPAFYIPGPEDAPISDFLWEAASLEIVYPIVRGIHTTFAMAHGNVLWSGMGGRIEDDPERIRDEVVTLCYPAWEVKYRLKFLQELKDYRKVFLFTTVPDHKGLHQIGSLVLAEIIKTYNPRLVLASGGKQTHTKIGKSLVVSLGRLCEGKFTLIDLPSGEVSPRSLQPSAVAA
jgi:uncharacterized protein